MAQTDLARKNLGRKLGLLGVVALFSGLFAAFVTGTFKDPYVWGQLAISFVGIAIFFITNLGSLGENFSGRGTVFLTSSLISTALVAGALVGVNYIVVKKPKSWDLTKDQIFTLSDQTTSLLKGLKEQVEVIAFYTPADPEYLELDQKLKQYQEQNPDKLKLTYIDGQKHPSEAKEFNISQGGPRVIFKLGGKESRTKEITEESLTNALNEVTRGASKKLYFSKGHGEHSITDATERGIKTYVDNLKGEGYLVDEILIADHKEMPADAQAVVVAGPASAFSDGEAKLLHDWVEKNDGKVFLMLDPATDSGLEKMLPTWGFQADNDEVLDPESQQPELAIAHSYAEHPITAPRSMPFQAATVFPLARSLTKLGNAPAGWTITELAKSGPHAWGETKLTNNGGSAEYNEGEDVKGPVTLAIAATHGSGANESRVVVIGNSMFVANGFYNVSGNRDFALNAASWVAHEESKIAIRPKNRTSNHLFLTADQKHTMTLFAFNLLPFSLLFAGLLVWQTRKSR